jgi:hypothetical protein
MPAKFARMLRKALQNHEAESVVEAYTQPMRPFWL